MDLQELYKGEYTQADLEKYRGRYLRTPLRAIREKCIDCSGFNQAEVRKCPCETCPLYEFRFGKKPERLQRKLTEEQRVALAKRLREARGKAK